MKKLIFLFFICLLAFSSCVSKLEFYVAVNGSDENPGTYTEPFKSLEKARDAIRELKIEGELKSPVTVYLRGGTYELSEPFVLKAEDSGTNEFPVTYQAYKNEKPIISGGREVRNWTKTELNGHSVLVSDLSALPEGYTPFEQLWVNGQRAIQARTPNSGYLRCKFDESVIKSMTEGLSGPMDKLPYLAEDEHNFDRIDDGVVVAFYKWLEFHLPFDSIDRKNDEIIFSGKTMRRIETNEAYYLEGGKAMLDNPGEWYLDRLANQLYYFPLENETDVVATIPSLVNVLRLEGDARDNKFVENIQFKGLTFSHSTWNLPRDASEPASYGQADIQMEGAVYLKGAKNCLFGECEITAIGNYGIEIGLGCKDIKVLSCDINDLGAGGLLIGPKIRPRSPKDGYQPGDTIPPVLEHPADSCSNIEVADCSIHDGGKYFHCAVGIWIGQSPNNHVHHNEIFNFYYSAISTGWTWGYGPGLATGNIFEYNHIHHIGGYTNGDGSVLSDLGGIYTLGDQTGTIIRNNIFHDIFAGKYGGWAIYCDEGSRNILIENNLAYRCRHACFNQHYGKNNLVRNNIFAFADTGPVMLARAEPHTSFILRNNIIVSDGTPIYAGGYAYNVESLKPIDSDSNLVWSTAGKVLGAQNRFPSRIYEPDEPLLSWEEWLELGNDKHTIVADPGFADAENGDFSLPENSPALKIGFKPFPLDEAGPRKKRIN